MAEKEIPPFDNHNFDEFNTPISAEARELLEKIEQSHEMRYKMMNLETWSLAKTMDAFLPGFWNRFLENRRTAMQQFIAQRRKAKPEAGEFLDDLAPSSDDAPQELMADQPPHDLPNDLKEEFKD